MKTNKSDLEKRHVICGDDICKYANAQGLKQNRMADECLISRTLLELQKKSSNLKLVRENAIDECAEFMREKVKQGDESFAHKWPKELLALKIKTLKRLLNEGP